MKLTTEIPQKEEPPVHITMRVDHDNDIAVQANGIDLLWIRKSGVVLLNTLHGRALAEIGFKISGGHIVVEE